MNKFATILLTTLLFVCQNYAFQQQPTATPTKSETSPKPQETPVVKKETSKFKKYEEVITAAAITKKGMFTTHEVGEKIFYEIDPKNLGKEYFWSGQVSRSEDIVNLERSYIKSLVMKFERLGDNILVRNVSYKKRFGNDLSLENAVSESNLDGILAVLKIETLGVNGSPVVDVTGMFKGDIDEMSPKTIANALSSDRSATFITSLKTFEKNIETRLLVKMKASPTFKSAGSSSDNVTAIIQYSLVALPEIPMRPRKADARIGFIDTSYVNFGSTRNEAVVEKLITRFRLEKKNPQAAVSDPIKPIVFYLADSVPQKWRKYVKEGVEMWKPAFEKAGFSNAIFAKDAPSKKENPNWDDEDIGNSMIRWLASENPNSSGLSITDPRTGEILKGEVRMYHNVIKLLQNWYFIQAGASDPRANKLPLADDLIGEILRVGTAHEVGHAIGLDHNMMSNNSFPVEKYRDLNFVKEFGLSASIMDYARFNYIAQPEDKVNFVTDKVGVYDNFAIEWGYKEFNNSLPVEADEPFLNEIANRQLTDSRLRYFGDISKDPRAQVEDLGDDAIQATIYGLKNLERVAEKLVNATSQNGEDFSYLRDIYESLILQYETEINHVRANIGGVETDNLVFGNPRSDAVRPTLAVKQRESVAFLLKYGFTTPTFLIRRDIVEKIGAEEVIRKVSRNYRGMLTKILSSEIVDRTSAFQLAGYEVYPSNELFDDMRKGIFAEIYSRGETPDVFRRNVQRAMIDHLASVIDTDKAPASPQTAARNSAEFKALSRNTLVKLKTDIAKALENTKVESTKIYYRDLLETISKAL